MILFDNPTDKWICNRCHEERDEAPLGDWDRCWNCDGDVWVAPHYRAWKKEPPTEPGWYWAVHNGRVEILEVGYRDGHILSYWESGLSTPPDPFPLDFVDYWLGPLPMPVPPEEE